MQYLSRNCLEVIWDCPGNECRAHVAIRRKDNDVPKVVLDFRMLRKLIAMDDEFTERLKTPRFFHGEICLVYNGSVKKFLLTLNDFQNCLKTAVPPPSN